MEEILGKLLVANNKIIQQGSKELKEALKNPEAIPALCEVITSSSNVQIRQSAAVILRRKLDKKRVWIKVELDTRNRIKQGILQALINEQEKLVKNAIAQFIGVVGKHEFPDNTWPEILQFIHNLCSSSNVIDRELGMYTLSIMTEISQSSYISHAESFAILFNNILVTLPACNSNLAYYTLMTMNNFVPVIGGHQQMINTYTNLFPLILEILNAFSKEDENKACELFEILEELVEYAVVVVVPHLRLTVEMCLRIGSDHSIPSSVQIKAVSVVSCLIRSKGKAIQKNKLVEPIIDVLIQLMAQKPEDDINEEYFFGDLDQSTTITIATQTLDMIALYIPAEKVIPFLLTRVEPAIQGNDIYAQKAAYLSLAVLAEGCSERIRNKYLEPFLKYVCSAIHNTNVVVRNAAFFALGQFAEHLQPEISKYAAELLPVLFEYMDQIHTQMQKEHVEPPSLDRLFYALETFCENLDEGLLPYLPTLMSRLLIALDPNGWSMELKKVALSTLSSVASAVKEGFMPYFQQVIEILNLYINADPNSDINGLQALAIETLAIIAQFIGADNFKPLTAQSIQLGLNILEKSGDPDTRKSVFALFAALSIVMKEELSPILPHVIKEMISTIQSSEGIVSAFEEEDTEDIDIYGCLSEEDDDEDANVEEDIEISSSDSDSEGCRYSVENAYTEEKEQACLSLREICSNTGEAFLPYLEKSFEEIFKLVNYPQEDIRKASIEALQEFCVCLYKVNTNETKHGLYKALQMIIPKCSELIRSDDERSIVMCCLDAYTSLLEEIKCDVLVGEGHKEAIMNCVIDVLTLKTMCQDTNLGTSTEHNDDEELEAEQDELLLESACDVIPKFASAIRPDDFMLYFPNILHLLTFKMKKQYSTSQRQFAISTLSECMKPLDVYVEKFVPTLLQLWIQASSDESEGVRQNAIFGLGEMVLHGKDRVCPYYADILVVLSNAVEKETHAGTLDNICAVLAKMMIVNSRGLPMDKVFPVFLQYLPLREDFIENECIIQCFFALFQEGHPIFKEHLATIIKIVVGIYHNKQSPDEHTNNVLVDLIKMIFRDFSEEFISIVMPLGQDVASGLEPILK